MPGVALKSGRVCHGAGCKFIRTNSAFDPKAPPSHRNNRPLNIFQYLFKENPGVKHFLAERERVDKTELGRGRESVKEERGGIFGREIGK